MQAAQWLVGILAIYGLAGILFAAAFVTFGVERIDPVARHAPAGFRVIVAPGAAALWPLLLARWLRGQSEPPPETNAHRSQVSAKEPS